MTGSSPAVVTPDVAVPAPTGRLLTSVVGATLLAQMPAFLLGGLAVFVREDLGFGRLGIGLAVSVFFFASMVGSMHGGRVAQQLGPRRGMLLGAAAGAAGMLAIAILARSWVHLALALVLAGLGNAVAQPAANLALARGIDRRRQGLAFGIKQSAVPLASLLAGVAVPVLALTVGWRWAFAAGAVLGTGLVLLVPATRAAPSRQAPAQRMTRPPRGQFRSLAVVGGLGAAGTTCTGAFLVEALAARDIGLAVAGIVLAVGSLAAVGMRLFLGWFVDRRTSQDLDLRLVAGCLVLAGAGFLAVGLAPVGVPLFLGAFLACLGASGWQGLFHYAVVRRSEVPAAATGVTQAGMFGGGVAGPAAFGMLVTAVSFRAAWLVLAVTVCASAVLVTTVKSRLPPVGDPR